MRKTFAPALLGALFLALPTLASPSAPPGAPCLPPPKGDSFTTTALVEIRGKLRHPIQFRAIYPPKDFVTISSGGQTYRLETGGFDALALRLNGKTVIVKGRLEKRKEPSPVYLPTWPPTLFSATHEVVVVTSIEAVEEDYVRRTEAVEVRGQLLTPRGAPESMAHKGVSHLISVNGTAYWLVLGGNNALHSRAKQLSGKTVVLTGTLEQRVGGMTVILVNDLREAV
jgi:hypothetical protein